MADVEAAAGVEMVDFSEESKKGDYKSVSSDNRPLVRGREDKDFSFEFSLAGLHKFWTSICRVEIGPPVLMTADDYGGGWFGGFAAWLDNTFRITDRGSSFYVETIGGITTFFVIAYVLTANPVILEGTGIPTNGSFFSTALTSGVFTTVMGLFTNLPVVLGPSLGLTFYFREIAETCDANPSGTVKGVPCDNWGKTTLPWTDALGAVYISGWFYLAITVTGFRAYLYDAIPKSLRAAIAVGTGFFLTMYGLKIGGITRVSIQPSYLDEMFTISDCSRTVEGNVACANPVNLGQNWYNIGIAHFHQIPQARIAVIGIVMAAALELYKWRGSFIIAIWTATFIGINYYKCNSQERNHDDYVQECVTDLHIWAHDPAKIPFIVDWSNNPAGRLTFKYANTGFFWQAVWTFLFFEIFDSYGALEGIITRMGLTRRAPTVHIDRVNRAMFVDGVAVWIGAIMGVNSMNVYIESNTGVEAGARTGFASFVTGSLLLLCLFFVYPFVAVIPPCATTGVLVMVGVYSLLEYKNIDFSCYINRFTAFITIAIMGFTFSITNGICAGCIFYCWLQILAVICQQIGLNANVIRPNTKVELPHWFLILMTIFMCCRFAFLGQN